MVRVRVALLMLCLRASIVAVAHFLVGESTYKGLKISQPAELTPCMPYTPPLLAVAHFLQPAELTLT